MLFLVHKYFLESAHKIIKFGLILLSLIGSLLHSTALHAGSPVSLYKSYAGNLSYVLAGASFRTNESTSCFTPNISNTASGNLNNLPATADIIAAYVYWTASYDASFDTPDTSVVFENTTLYDFSPETETFRYNGDDLDFYSGKADVTSIVDSRRNASYAMSGLEIEAGNPHCTPASVLGGWALVVIYEDDSEPTRVVNLYDGFQLFRGNGFPITANNFEISSNPSGKHAHITWEGDVGNSASLNGYSEALNLTTQSGSRELTDSTNPSGEQFNSRSNIYGTASPTYGLDIDEYDIGSFLTPGEKSFTTSYSSGGDLVLLTAEITSVSNITVADLSVTTTNPISWLEGSTVSKKFTITNNGPNDVPINSVEFNTTLPGDLTFSGTQGNSDWSCTQTGQNLSCIYKPKLRAGWTDYLDITFDVANVAGTDVTVLASVNHDNAPYDIFDNQAANDIYEFTTPVEDVAVVDLSASSKTYTDVSGDLLLAEDTLRYTITIDDASNLTANGIIVTDDLPANITITPNAYTIISSPVTETFVPGGGANGTGLLTFSGINLAPGATEKIIYEVKVDANAQEGDSLRNIAEINYNSSTWSVDTGDITVTVIKPDLSPSTIEAIDKNGGLLESGDTISITITLDDLYDTDISTLQATMGIPALIDSFNVTNSHTGTDNSSSFFDIQNISFSNSETPTLELELVIDPAAIDGTTYDLSAELKIGSDLWTLVAPTLVVTNSQPASSGNKQLYIDTANTLSRIRPTDSEIDIPDDSPATRWTLTPALNNPLTFDITDISLELRLEGNRGRNRTTDAEMTFSLYQGDGTLIADRQQTIFLRRNRIDPIDLALNKNPAITNNEITLNTGDSLYLEIATSSGDNTAQNGRRVTLHTIDNMDNSKSADGYSAIILNASTVINVDSIDVWSAPFNDTDADFIDDSGATLITQSEMDTTLSVRSSISDPFGAFDISAAQISITKVGEATPFISNLAMSSANIDNPADDNSTSSKLFEANFSLAETGEPIGDWIIAITGFEGVEGDVEHSQVKTFKIIPFQPNITLSKSITVLNDPINGTSNPKAIPSAELKYAITAKNTGRGYADDGSVVIKDEIPLDAELYIEDISCINRGDGSGLGPVCYQDGTTPNESGLTYDFTALDDTPTIDHIQFSQDGSNYTYTPVDEGDGYDSSIRFIKITPTGNFNASDKNVTFEPQFTFEYQIRLK